MKKIPIVHCQKISELHCTECNSSGVPVLLPKFECSGGHAQSGIHLEAGQVLADAHFDHRQMVNGMIVHEHQLAPQRRLQQGAFAHIGSTQKVGPHGEGGIFIGARQVLQEPRQGLPRLTGIAFQGGAAPPRRIVDGAPVLRRCQQALGKVDDVAKVLPQRRAVEQLERARILCRRKLGQQLIHLVEDMPKAFLASHSAVGLVSRKRASSICLSQAKETLLHQAANLLRADRHNFSERIPLMGRRQAPTTATAMKQAFLALATSTMVATMASAQLGLGGGLRYTHPTEWQALLEAARGISAAAPARGSYATLSYWFRLRSVRVEFAPGLRLAQQQFGLDPEADLSLDILQAAVEWPVQVYPFDLNSDCDCPTFSKQGSAWQKGLFVAVVPSLAWQRYAPPQEMPLPKGTQLVVALALRAGLDVGITNAWTLTLQASAFATQPWVWEPFADLLPQTPPSQTPSSAKGWEAGLVWRYRWKH